MSKLEEFKVDESKEWFGEYWPKGAPKQIYEVEGIVVEPLFEGFQRERRIVLLLLSILHQVREAYFWCRLP